MEDELKDTTLLVREVLGGRPISSIGLNTLDKLKIGLKEAREKAIQLGQVGRIRLIRKANREIQKIEQARKIEEQKSLRSNSDYFPKHKPTHEELQTILNDAYQGMELERIETDMLLPVIKECKRLIQSLIKEGDYDTAQEYENMRRKIYSIYKERNTFSTRFYKSDTIQKKLQKAEKKCENAKIKYQEELENHEIIKNEALEKLLQQNEDELNQFDEETNGPLPPFNKTFSSQFQNLRETEKHLLKARRYRDAAIVREKAREMAEYELEKLEDKRFRTREAQRELLLDKQQAKIDCLITKYDAIKIEIDDRNVKIIDSLKQAIDNIEQKLDLVDSSIRLNQNSPPDIPEIDLPYHSVEKRSQVQRRLDCRLPWNISSARPSRPTTLTSDISEPHWKTIEPRPADSYMVESSIQFDFTTSKSGKAKKVPVKSIKSINDNSTKEQPTNLYSSQPIIYNRNQNELSTSKDQTKKRRNNKNSSSQRTTNDNQTNIYQSKPITRQQSAAQSNVNSRMNSAAASRSPSRLQTVGASKAPSRVPSRSPSRLQTIEASKAPSRVPSRSPSRVGSVQVNQNTRTEVSYQSASKKNISYQNNSNKNAVERTRVVNFDQSARKTDNYKPSTARKDEKKYNNQQNSNLTFTQSIDARRTQSAQTKEKIGLEQMFGKKSDFELFCESLPPSKKQNV